MATNNAVDRGAGSQIRQRRSLQRLNTPLEQFPTPDGKSIVLNAGVLEVVPNTAEAINTSSAGVGMTLASAGAMQFSGGALAVKLADTSLKTATAGLSANLASSSGLLVSSGLKVNVDGSTITINGSNQLVAASAYAPDATTITLNGSSKLQVNFDAAGGLYYSGSGDAVKLADTSLKTATAGLSANLASSSGLLVSSGLKVNVDGSTITINGSNQLVAASAAPDATTITLNGSSKLQVNFDAAGGLYYSGSGDAVKLADNSLQTATAGLSAKLESSGGLTTTTLGLAVKPANSSILLSGSGAQVQLNNGLTIIGGAGVGVLAANNTITVTSSGVAVNTASSSGLSISGGLAVNLSSSGGLTLASNQLAVNVDGVTTSLVGGQLVANVLPSVSSDPASPTAGQAWYNTAVGRARIELPTGAAPITHTLFSTATDASVTANTTAQTIAPYTFIIPAGMANKAGAGLKMHVFGTFTAAAANTWTLLMYLNGSPFTAIFIDALSSGGGGAVIDINLSLLCDTTGTSGQMKAVGHYVGTANGIGVFGHFGPNEATFNLTSTLTVSFAVSAASNTGDTLTFNSGEYLLVG